MLQSRVPSAPLEKRPTGSRGGDKEVLDHVVVGAGVCGLVAAGELQKAGKRFIILEKSSDIMGCWQHVANSTSHVAVCEPAYRFDMEYSDHPPSDFTSRAEICEQGKRFVQERGFKIRFRTIVLGITDLGDGRWEVLHAPACPLPGAPSAPPERTLTRAVFLAVGAQQVPRSLSFPGEDAFRGTVNYGIRDQMDPALFKGAQVCIVGSGAFAVENVRTALLHGAAHVTMVHRGPMQCWPRLLHYYASVGNTSFGELRKVYDEAVAWAGLQGLVAPFMSRTCVSQPTASDIFFVAFKKGLLSLKRGQVTEVTPGGVRLDTGEEAPCDVLLKCVGWQEPDISKVFPGFSSRRFIFLNGHASMAFASDPHYQHQSSGNDKSLHVLENVKVKGGTFSVLALATVSIRLQMLFMKRPTLFRKAMEQLAESSEPVCGWFQQKWEFQSLPEVNRIIDDTLGMFKSRMGEKFPAADAFLAMAEASFHKDWAHFSTEREEYIFSKNIRPESLDVPVKLVGI